MNLVASASAASFQGFGLLRLRLLFVGRVQAEVHDPLDVAGAWLVVQTERRGDCGAQEILVEIRRVLEACRVADRHAYQHRE